jgi:hypothetical protein
MTISIKVQSDLISERSELFEIEVLTFELDGSKPIVF